MNVIKPQIYARGFIVGAPFESKYDPEKYRPKVAYHKVTRGQTLSSIARRYGVSVRQIMQWNGLRNANRIYVGQRLAVSPP